MPALHEEGVLAHTLQTLARQDYPPDAFKIIVSLAAGDDATIGEAMAVRDEFPDLVQVVVQPYHNGNKPKQLNAAMIHCTGDYVGIFDAEDEAAPELLAHVEALIRGTNADVVQGGIQLMNLDLPATTRESRLGGLWAYARRGWFCVHNVMEYYFWFSSRMFYQVDQGFVPLGGNTVFVRRTLLEQVGGWDENRLTEDCALGVKLCVEHGAKVVAAYSSDLATREETPERIFGPGSLARQRNRWNQGFIQVLVEGRWRRLPSLRQQLMALYILTMPMIQAFNGVMLPISIAAFFLLKAPVGLVLIMFTPFFPLTLTILLQLAGLREFSRHYGQPAHFRHHLSLVVGSYPYQVILAWAAVHAAWRHLRKQDNWLKTSHAGLHRISHGPAMARVEETAG